MTKIPEPLETEYGLTRQIPSVYLEKDTVALIEGFLLERASQVNPPRARSDALFLSVTDSSGPSRLWSIRDYPFASFEEGIESVFVSYGAFGDALSITVSFAKSAEESRISVTCRSMGARAVAEGLADGIIRILQDVGTVNQLYYPGPLLRGALTALFLMAFGVQIGFFAVYGKLFPFLLPLALILYLYLYLAPMFKPYTTFDTLRNRGFRSWSTSWIEATLVLLLVWLAISIIGLGLR